MEFNTANIIPIFIQGGYFVASFAAIAAGVIMASVTKKFGTGILASGFKSISVGVMFIAGGIILDSITAYLITSNYSLPTLTVILVISKEAFFVIGTYIIVIGSKKTGDKLESLTK